MSYYQFNSLESCEKQKKDIPKKNLLNIVQKKKRKEERKEKSKDLKNVFAKDKEHQKRKMSATDSVQQRNITK